MLEAYQADLQSKQGQRINYNAKIKNINGKLNRLKELYLDALIDKDTYKNDYQRLQKELAGLAIASKRQIVLPSIMTDILQDEDFAKTYWDLPRAQQRELWQLLIKRIIILRRPEERGKPYTQFKIEFM